MVQNLPCLPFSFATKYDLFAMREVTATCESKIIKEACVHLDPIALTNK